MLKKPAANLKTNSATFLPVDFSFGAGLGDLDFGFFEVTAASDDLDLDPVASSCNFPAASDLDGAGLDDLVRP